MAMRLLSLIHSTSDHYNALIFCSSLARGMPLVLAEAMCSAVPVITTPLGGVAEMLFPQVGLIFLLDHANALVGAII
jgi:glycosyltransferase involved in cell wall biosynthesis